MSFATAEGEVPPKPVLFVTHDATSSKDFSFTSLSHMK